MKPSNVTNAQEVEREEREETSEIIIDLYIGVFFDGTNNNKLQSAIGQKFRRNEIFQKHERVLKSKGFKNITQVVARSRKEWELENIFSRDELDKMYGSADIGTTDLETDILKDQNTKYSWSSVNIDENSDPEEQKIKNTLHDLTKPEEQKKGYFKNSDLEKDLGTSFSRGATLTNPGILSCLYRTSSDQSENKKSECQEFHHSVYVEGSGADSFTEPVGFTGRVIGLGFGVGITGVAEKCKKAIRQIRNIYNTYNSNPEISEIKVHLDVFGFSRGAATARLFTYIVNPDTCFNLTSDDYNLFTGNENIFLPYKKDNPNSKLTLKEVRKLGIYDTVASIGILRNSPDAGLADLIGLDNYEEFSRYRKSVFHDSNVDDFGLHSTDKVKDVLHICALDENRVNFSLTDIESSIGKNGTEIFIPGCHTDIGGGCSLGLDALKIVNVEEGANKMEICFHNTYPFKSLKGNDIIPVSAEAMRELGWAGRETGVTTNTNFWFGRANEEALAGGDSILIENTRAFGFQLFNNIGIYKYCVPGYSNISLNLMHEWCNKEDSLFNDIPPHYPIPSDLREFYAGLKRKALGSKGRFFCVPRYYDEYRKLRCKYLHFSMNQRIMDNSLSSIADSKFVNGPNMSFIDNRAIISRRIYVGKANSNTAGNANRPPSDIKYMYDYEGGNGQMVQLGCNVAEVEVTSRDS